MSNWPNNFDLSHPNWTASTPSRPRSSWAECDGKGGYAPNSGTPPWGWPLTIVCAVVIVVAVGGFLSYAGAVVGFGG